MSNFYISSVFKTDRGCAINGNVRETYFTIAISDITNQNDFINHHRQNEASIILSEKHGTVTTNSLVQCLFSVTPLTQEEFPTYFVYLPKITESIFIDIGNKYFHYNSFGITPMQWTVATGMILAVL